MESKRLSFDYDTIGQSLSITQKAKGLSCGALLNIKGEAEIRDFIRIAKCVEDAYKRSKQEKV